MIYQHQQKILDENPKKALIALQTGGGKTRVALLLSKGETLVVCPKTIRDARTWQKEAQKLKVKEPTVISKEEFKTVELPRFDTVILDEAHVFAGVSPDFRWRNKEQVPKASQLYEAMKRYLDYTRPERVYLLTATPVRSPMSVWALATLLGANPDFRKFRSALYVPIQINGHERWLPRQTKEAKERLGKYVRKMGYTGKLEDWFDVPEQTHKVMYCELSKEQRAEIQDLELQYPDPLVLVGKIHQAEQGKSKLETIADLQLEFKKVLVFAKYTKQIQEIEAFFRKKKVPTYTLTGATKNRDWVLDQTDSETECVFVVQSSIAAGWEAPSFRCTIYASQSWSVVDHVQSVGRTLRANNLQKNLYVYLLSGEVDEMVYKCIEGKVDFSEKIYEEKRSSIHDTIPTVDAGESNSTSSV